MKKKILMVFLAGIFVTGGAYAEIAKEYLSPILIRKIDWALLTYSIRQKGEQVPGGFIFVDASYAETDRTVVVYLKSFRKLRQRDSNKLREAIESIGLDPQSTFSGFDPSKDLVVSFLGQNGKNSQTIYAQYRRGQIGFTD